MNIDEVLSGQAGPAGVRHMLRGRRSRGMLRDALRSRLARSRELGPCRLYRAKFKPGRALTGYYQVATSPHLTADPPHEATPYPAGSDPLTEAHPHLAYRSIAVRWSARPLTEADAGTRDRECAVVERLEAEARQRGLLAPFESLEAYLSAWRMQVRIEPLDPAFPQLVRLSDGAYLREVLNGGRYQVRTVRYRPGYRHVLLIRDRADGRAPSLFAKLSRGAAGARLEETGRALADALADRGDGVAVARPFAYLADDDTSLWLAVPGRPLSRILRQGDPLLGARLAAAGTALRTLHGLPADIISGERVGWEEEVRLIERANEHVRALLPDVGPRVSKVLERAASLLTLLPVEGGVLTHGDYKADHLLVDGARMTMIDLDRCARGERATDLGKFLADLRWWLTGGDAGALTSAQQRFLAGYGRVDAAVLRRAHLYEAMFLLKLAAHRAPVHHHAWQSLISGFVAQAESVLDRLEER